MLLWIEGSNVLGMLFQQVWFLLWNNTSGYCRISAEKLSHLSSLTEIYYRNKNPFPLTTVGLSEPRKNICCW